jgi:hypothetical protein
VEEEGLEQGVEFGEGGAAFLAQGVGFVEDGRDVALFG